MKLALIGATGFVGTALLGEALRRNHEVTAISRHADRLGTADPKVKAVNISVFDVGNLSRALERHDAVVSAYNAGWTNPKYREDFLKGADAIEKAAEAAKVNRLFVVGGAGSLEAAPGVQLVDTPEFPEEFRAAAKVVRDYLALLKSNKTLEWTFLSPAIIMSPEVKTGRTGHYRIGADQPVFDAEGASMISVEDLAVAALDELERSRFIRKRFTVAY